MPADPALGAEHVYVFEYRLRIGLDVTEAQLVSIANSTADHMAHIVGYAAHSVGVPKPIIEVSDPREV